MDLKSRVRRQLLKVREVSETFLAAFHTPEQWTLKVHDKANHALWFAGHLGTVDNFMISLLAPEKAIAIEVGSIFEMAVWHEALHAGQVTVARRALGVPPLVDVPPKSETAG